MNTRTMNRSLRWLFTTCLILTMLLTVAGPAQAASFVVTNLNDSGKGSLRQAIFDASTSPGADTITFGVSGTILLSSTLGAGDPAGLTIDGTGRSITISGNEAVRVMSAGGVLTLRHLTITGGYDELYSGAGLTNGGTLTVTDTTFIGNWAQFEGGGGIYNLGTLTVINSTFSFNTAGFSGGAIFSSGKLSVTNSTFSGNFAGSGGAITNGGTLTVTDTTFAGNSAGNAGGAIDNYDGTLEVTNSTFQGNNGGNYGGGISNSTGTGTVIVTDSTFPSNSAENGGGISNWGTLSVADSTFSDDGGAIFNGGTAEVTSSTFSASYRGGIFNLGTLAVTDSTFSGNYASYLGGAIYNGGTLTVTGSTFSGNSTIQGGGIYNGYDATLSVTDSTFSGNTANSFAGYDGLGGGINNTGTAEVTDSTFSGNTANSFEGHDGLGGGINNTGMLEVTNSTFSGNSAAVNGGGIFNSGTATLKNTLIADSPSGGNCSGLITDGGGNLSWPDTTCPGLNADPLLGPLQDNGGPTQTHALLAGSPAIDAALLANCPATDQRGVSRPQGAGCDIGAFELEMNPIYNFSGFFPPVDNLPTMNTVKAGKGIPVKFSLGGDQGLDIFAAGYPVSQQVVCDSATAQDAIEETVTVGASNLSYDAASDTYTYLWKTSKSWVGTCRQLNVKLNDGTEHKANFKFVR